MASRRNKSRMGTLLFSNSKGEKILRKFVKSQVFDDNKHITDKKELSKIFKGKDMRDLKDALFLLNYANMSKQMSAKEYFSNFAVQPLKALVQYANLDRLGPTKPTAENNEDL
jgi:hypothetical protein